MVLDTNVIVSAHLNAEGYERHVLDLALTRKLRVYVSPEILGEYEGVLARPKFGIGRRQIAASMRLMRNSAKLIRPLTRLHIAHDESDNRFLECAQAAKADYLVTGNKRDFPNKWRRTQIVNARELLEWIVPLLRR